MISPVRKPFSGLRHSTGADVLTEAVGTTRTIIAPTMQETTAGTIHTRRRFRPIGGVSAPTLTLPFVHIFSQTSSTGGDWTAGKVYFAGSDLTLSPAEPTTITVDASHYCFWIKVDFSAASAGWYSGTAFPAMDDSTEIFRMLEVVFTDGAIVSFLCPTAADIHVTAKSS